MSNTFIYEILIVPIYVVLIRNVWWQLSVNQEAN